MINRILITGLLILVVSSCSLYKPSRVLSPESVSGITCKSETICLDDISRYEEAEKLYEEAFNYVNISVDEIENKPRVIFCATKSCFNSFGFDKAAAQTIGTSGIVISPRGWKYYYIRHEFIHHLQAEKMGVISQWRSTEWFKEGMAYLLSNDPREKLSKNHQEYREKFAKWYRSYGKDNLWEAAQNL